MRLNRQLETAHLYHTEHWRWNEIEVLITTDSAKVGVEANYTEIKHIKRTGPGTRSPNDYRCRALLTGATRTAA